MTRCAWPTSRHLTYADDRRQSSRLNWQHAKSCTSGQYEVRTATIQSDFYMYSTIEMLVLSTNALHGVPTIAKHLSGDIIREGAISASEMLVFLSNALRGMPTLTTHLSEGVEQEDAHSTSEMPVFLINSLRGMPITVMRLSERVVRERRLLRRFIAVRNPL